MKLSNYQQEMLDLFKNLFGNDWFVCSQSHVSALVKRPAYTLETLHKKGALERRTNPQEKSLFSDDYWQYRVSAYKAQET